MKTLGDKLNIFDNLKEQSVRTFNLLFDIKLTGYKETDTVSIGEIASNTNTRQLLINNIAMEFSFVRRTTSENNYIDLGDNTIDDSDSDWLFYFV